MVLHGIYIRARPFIAGGTPGPVVFYATTDEDPQWEPKGLKALSSFSEKCNDLFFVETGECHWRKVIGPWDILRDVLRETIVSKYHAI